MRSLNLDTPLIIMMVGIPGSGKSFFARNFSKVFQTPLVSFDEIQYTLFAQPTFSREEEILIANVMRLQITQLLKTGKTFLIDGSLSTRTSRMAIERLAAKNGFATLTIWIQTDDASAQYRAIKRSAKRLGDKYNYPMNEEQFAEGANKVTFPEEKETHVVISGKHTFASQVKTVLKKIIKPRSSQSPPERPTSNSPATRTTSTRNRRTIALS